MTAGRRPRRDARRVSAAPNDRPSGAGGFVVLPAAFFGLPAPSFPSVGHATTIPLDASVLAGVARARAVVVLARHFGLHRGAGEPRGLRPGARARAAPLVLAPVAIGGLCGAVNGLLVACGRVPAAIATRDTMSILRERAALHTGGERIALADLPPCVGGFADGRLAGPPAPPLVAIAVVAGSAAMPRRLAAGRRIHAVASNAKDDPGRSDARRSSAMRAHPVPRLLISGSGISAPALDEANEDAGRRGEVHATGHGLPDAMTTGVANGTVGQHALRSAFDFGDMANDAGGAHRGGRAFGGGGRRLRGARPRSVRDRRGSDRRPRRDAALHGGPRPLRDGVPVEP